MCKYIILTNIANYILFFSIILFTILFIIYLKSGLNLIERDIEQILSQKKKFKNKTKNRNINVNINKNTSYNINNILKFKRREKKSKTDINKRKNKITNPPKFKRKAEKSKTQTNRDKTKYDLKSVSNVELNKKENLLISESHNDKIQIYNKKKKNLNKIQKNKKIHFYDSELNSLSYQQALVFDQRTYIDYYLSLIKTKHPLKFSFSPNSDYNLIIIKIGILILSFSIYFAINTLFFNDSEIHEIYINNGKTNISDQIPKIIYCFFISHFICCFIKYLTLSERNLLNLKYENKLKDSIEKADKVKRCVFIKYLIFFILGFIFLIFFWYYLSSFDAVYHNSQIYPFINTLIGISISILLYPFIINLIPGIFRIPSLRNNRNLECLYIMSKIIQFL